MERPADAVFPKEIFRISRRWAQTRFSDLRQFNELAGGGHLATMEQPQAYLDEVRSLFRDLR